MSWTDVLKLLAVMSAVGVATFVLIEWAAHKRKNGRD